MDGVLKYTFYLYYQYQTNISDIEHEGVTNLASYSV